MKNFNLAQIKQNINLIGRCAFVGEKLFCDFTASGFEFRANFKNTPVSVTLEAISEIGHFGVMLDDDYENMRNLVTPVGKQELTIFENLDGVHTIRFVKLYEFSHGSSSIESVNFSGEIEDKPEVEKLKFEFYGDSLTCGYGNLSTTRNSPNPFNPLEHGYKTWCIRLARHFGARANIVSQSGQGIVFDCTGNPKGVVFRYFDKDVMRLGVKHDFSAYVPDVVFIYLGTNDINYVKNSNTKMDWQHFKSESKRLIDHIRANAPECKIVLLAGHEKGGNPVHDELVVAYNEIVGEYQNMFFFDDIVEDKLGGDWHPNVDDHKYMYEQIYPRLEKILK